MLKFQTFLPLKEPLVAIQWTCAFTSRKCVFESGISIPDLLEKPPFFLSQSSNFAWKKQPENLNFHSFSLWKIILAASFNERHAVTSRKNVAEKGILMPN